MFGIVIFPLGVKGQLLLPGCCVSTPSIVLHYSVPLSTSVYPLPSSPPFARSLHAFTVLLYTASLFVRLPCRHCSRHRPAPLTNLPTGHHGFQPTYPVTPPATLLHARTPDCLFPSPTPTARLYHVFFHTMHRLGKLNSSVPPPSLVSSDSLTRHSCAVPTA